MTFLGRAVVVATLVSLAMTLPASAIASPDVDQRSSGRAAQGCDGYPRRLLLLVKLPEPRQL